MGVPRPVGRGPPSTTPQATPYSTLRWACPPRWALAGLYSLCGGMVVYTNVDMLYHVATLIGRVVLRQPVWQWPPLSNRPWMSTSIADFWAPAGTSSSDTCSSSTARDQAERCSGGPERC